MKHTFSFILLLTTNLNFAMQRTIHPLLPRMAQSAQSYVIQKYLDKNGYVKLNQIQITPPPSLPKTILVTIKAYVLVRAMYG